MAEMMKSACLKLIAKLDERDQDAVLARLDELQAQGIPAKDAQVQAVADVILNLKREAFGDPGQYVPDADDGSIKKSHKRLPDDLQSPAYEEGAMGEGGSFRTARTEQKEAAFKAKGLVPVLAGGVGEIWVKPNEADFIERHGFGVSHLNQTALHAYQVAERGLDPNLIRSSFVDELVSNLDESADAANDRFDTLRDAAIRATKDIKKSQARDITETPEFKRWWGGDNTMVDANGKPLVLYHGTTKAAANQIGVFRRSKYGAMGPAIYLGDSPESSAGYDQGAMLKVYARGKYLNNRQWSDYVAKHGWAGAETAARADGWSGVYDEMFESAIAVWNPQDIKSADKNNGQFDPANPDIRKSTTRNAMGFYSALAKGIDSMPTKAAPAGAWKAQIKGLVNKGAVKQDEIFWSGLEDWLDLQQGKVTKEQIADYLKQGGVNVQETVLSENAPDIDISHIEWDGDWEVFTDRDYRVFSNRYDALDFANSNGGTVQPHKDDEGLGGGVSRDMPKYSQYTLPGGENYREVLLTLPSKPTGNESELSSLRAEALELEDRGDLSATENGELNRIRSRIKSIKDKAPEQYKSSHWDQSNVVAHIRVNDRTDADGNKVLFVEELQSDWGQDGKKKGFAKRGSGPSLPEGWTARKNDAGTWRVLDQNGDLQAWGDTEEQALSNALGARVGLQSDGVPSAPFVTKTEGWLNLALKRIVTMAVDGSYDKVAFVNGEQSADRYDLSKQIGSVEATKTMQGKYAVTASDLNGRRVVDDIYDADKLSDVVGKELADRIVSEATSSPAPGERHSVQYRGLDLKVGGAGMRSFYDSIVPNAVKKLISKMDGKLETVAIEQPKGKPTQYADFAAWKAAPEVATIEQPGFTITPKMQEQVSGQGMPLFSRARNPQENTPEFKEWSGSAPVVHLGEKHEFVSGQPVVVEALHGTTNSDLTEFKRERANIESDWGAGFYASNTPDDVAANYANNEGADLTNRIELMAERLAADEEFSDDMEAARKEAKRRLTQESPNTLKLYIRMSNPAVQGGKGETFFDYTDEYDEETDSYAEPTGKLVDFVESLRSVAPDFIDADADGAMGSVWEGVNDEGGIGLSDLVKALKSSDGLAYATDEDGNSASTEVIRRALEDMGFDGVIDTTVAGKFKNMKGMNKDTVHFIAFDPTQLKSATGNQGTFDPKNPDIRKSNERAASPDFVVDDERGKNFLFAEFDDGAAYVQFAGSNDGKIHVLAINTEESESVRGRDILRWLSAAYGKPVVASEVAQDARRYWNRMEDEGLVEGWSEDEFSGEAAPLGIKKSNERTVGDYGREYTPEQRAMFKNIGRTVTKPTLIERLKNSRQDLGKRMTQGIVDQFAPLKELGNGAYTLARLSKGAAGAFEALLGHGKLKIVDGAYDADMTGGFIDRVGKPLGKELEDFMNWVAANRAEKLMAEDREHLFTQADIDAGKSLADGDLKFDYLLQNGATTRDRKLAYEDSLKKFNEFNKNVMDIAEQSGLIDPESRKLWENEFYVPFYRVSEEEGEFVGAKIKGGLVRKKAFEKLKGGSGKLNADLTANVMQNWAHLIDASAKNRAAKATLEASTAAGIATEADEETVRQLGKVIGKEGGTVWFMDEGKKRHFVVGDPYILDAINSLEYAGLRGPLMDALSTMKHVLTVGVTASPAFKVRNLIRDSIQAMSISDLSYNPIENFRAGVKASARDSQEYVSALASGGLIRFGSMLEGNSAERVRKLINSGVDPSTILDTKDKVKAVFSKALGAYEEIGNRGEEINRAALYTQLRKKGMSHSEAALAARDLMDFSLQGTFGTIRFLTQVVPFLNARLQGLYKLGRGAAEDPKRFSTVLGATALASIALLAAYGDDDDWKRREDWDRDGFWWFKFGGTAFRIPKPFEIGAIATLAERGVELFTNDQFTTKMFGARVLSIMGDNLSMNPIPQAVKPILDVYSNKDSFSGRPIESMGMERLKSEYRYTADTSMIARASSSAMNAATGLIGKEALSPVQIDSMLRGYFGWLGTFVVAGADMAIRPLTNEPTRPQADYLKVVTQGFLKSLPDSQSKYVSAMYEQAQELERAYATHRQMIKEGKMQDASEFAKEHKDQLARYRQVEAVKKVQSAINEQVRRIERSDMDPAKKREEIQKLRLQASNSAERIYGR